MNRSISVPDDLDARVEKARGDIPRSVFWVRAMERALGDVKGDRIPERPAPPRSPSPQTVHAVSQAVKSAPKVERHQKAQGAMSAALARQRALNKSRGI